MIIKNFFNNVLIYLIVLLNIIQCNTLSGELLPRGFVILLNSFCILFLIFTYGSFSLKHNASKLLAAFLVCSGLLVILGDFKDISFLLSGVLFFICSYILYEKKNFLKEFMRHYVNVMFCISVISLFFFVFATCMHLIPKTGYYPYTMIHWGKVNYNDYFHIYNEGQHGDFGFYSGFRNIGIFLEAPMYTYCLVLALYFEFLFSVKRRNFVIVTLCVTLVTTLSTTAYLCVLLMGMYIFFYSKKINKNIKVFGSIFILTAVGIAVSVLYAQKMETARGSILIRTDDIMAGLKCFSNNPIFGAGYNNVAAIDKYRSVDIFKELKQLGYHRKVSNTLSSGMLGVLSSGGILLGVWYVFPPLVSITHLFSKKYNRNNLFFILVNTLLLLVSVVHTRSLCTMIAAMNWFFILHPKYSPDGNFSVLRIFPEKINSLIRKVLAND